MQNPTTSLFGDYPGKQWACSQERIPSRQHFEKELRQLNSQLHRRNLYMLSVRRSTMSRRRRMKPSLRRRHPGRNLIQGLNDSIRLQMYIFTRGKIQTKLVSNWLHGKLEICGDMSSLLTMPQDSSSVQNSTPRQPFQAFRRWSWHVCASSC